LRDCNGNAANSSSSLRSSMQKQQQQKRGLRTLQPRRMWLLLRAARWRLRARPDLPGPPSVSGGAHSQMSRQASWGGGRGEGEPAVCHSSARRQRLCMLGLGYYWTSA
jgi:hypothetical protein